MGWAPALFWVCPVCIRDIIVYSFFLQATVHMSDNSRHQIVARSTVAVAAAAAAASEAARRAARARARARAARARAVVARVGDSGSHKVHPLCEKQP